MADQREIKVLRSLHRIVEAGEKGFATVAANVPDPALKFLFKRYAQQRARFKEAIMTEIERLGHTMQPGSSIPGMIHRGRIAIFSEMSIGKANQEKVVLKEAVLGERVAVRAYERALAAGLNLQSQEILRSQYDEVRKVSEEVNLIRGEVQGQRILVRLFEKRSDVDEAARALQKAGFSPESIEQITLREEDIYRGKGTNVRETLLSGTFGGALWGSLTGVLVGFGIVQANHLAGGTTILMTILLAIAGFMLLGAFIAAVLALFIGMGIAEGDNFDYKEILTRLDNLLMIKVDTARVDQANEILDQEQQSAVQPGLSPSV